ncbi:group II intron reverse transcriptase/maturase [Tepidibacter sp. Z1-5]|uniref:group II intron reverse transcriptase/maturase n=1 Tax=Tepidibacter sp. Z1-5 TaxID=3134138 RepID=UPI0030BFCB8D
MSKVANYNQMKPLTNSKLRHNEYYNQQEKLDKLYSESKENKVFQKLMPLIISEENIQLAFRNIKSNTGSKTSGTDSKDINYIKNLSVEEVVNLVREKLYHYEPEPVKRVNIPKPNGKLRPLGIPTITDRLIQQCILQILEPICEAKFSNHSYGFRPGRSAEHAIAEVYKHMQIANLHYVVDVDIKGFFDNVDHNKLIKQMWSLGIRDKKLICIIKAMLKATIIHPDGTEEIPNKGTPQGGILSPLLANIVLNEFDKWIESQWENIPMTKKYTPSYNKNGGENKGNKYAMLRSTSKLKEMYIVRYADDFKIFCRDYETASRTFKASKMWLMDRLKLEISPEKSKITNVRKNYTEFLGFKIKVRKKRKTHTVTSHMCDKAVKNVARNLKQTVKYIQHPKSTEYQRKNIRHYNSTVMGIHHYYGIATNINLDCAEIGKVIRNVMFNRLELSKSGSLKDFGAILKKYGKSQEMRYLDGLPVIPIRYVQTSPPKFLRRNLSPYTEDGRKLMHKSLGVSMNVIRKVMQTKGESKNSIEFNDNRISKFVSQYGKCAVTGSLLSATNFHCHHIIPKKDGGTDEYGNLVIVLEDVHILIHATLEETITKHLPLIENQQMLTKLNKYRTKCGNEKLVVNF